MANAKHMKQKQSTITAIERKAELVRADTALQSFRDAGYSFGDAIGEIVDNSIQAGARKIKFDWYFQEKRAGRSPKAKREVTSLAVADDGQGIPSTILPHVLTIGFSTRYNSRDGIGRFGVGFKLASISQAKRLEIYTKPAFQEAEEVKDEMSGESKWVPKTPNKAGTVYMSYLDLDEIKAGTQREYVVDAVEGFPEEFMSLMDGFKTGTLIVWRKIDRMNETKAYAETLDEKIADLNFFLSRTYRIYIDQGIQIYLPDKSGSFTQFQSALVPYDPTFQLDNPIANELAKGYPMKGEYVEEGAIDLDGGQAIWKIYLTPKVTRMVKGGGGTNGPSGKGQFQKLHIPKNQNRISFLRFNREVSYVKMGHFFPNDNEGGDKDKSLDRFIGIEVYFSPELDEYFQVKHIKRGVEPIEKLREELRKVFQKPVIAARKRIRELWKESEDAERNQQNAVDVSGGRSRIEETVKEADTTMPHSRGGQTITPDEQNNALRSAAVEMGITEPEQQEKFIRESSQKPMRVLDTEWSGRGLLDIEHLNTTVMVKINRRHPFIREVYLPLKEELVKSDLDFEGGNHHLLRLAVEGIDLLFSAYAKAESMSPTPEEDYMELREDWGKFAAVYLKKNSELNIA